MRTIISLILLGVAMKAMPQIIQAEYLFDNNDAAYGQGITLTVPGNSGEVTISDTLSVDGLMPGIHQAFFRVKDAFEGWSMQMSKLFLIPRLLDTVIGFSYRIDPQSEGSIWSYKPFLSPSIDVSYSFEIDLGDISKGIHYIEAMAVTKGGIWTPVSKGTFFSLYSEPLNITSLEYYFEAGDASASAIYSVSNFTPAPNITLDSVTFSIPVSSLENLKSYFIYVRAVDEEGNKSFFLSDTIVYRGPTDLKEKIYIEKGMMLFPNPVSDLLNIRLFSMNTGKNYIVKLFDAAGRKVIEKELFFGNNEYTLLETSGLKSGVYRIVIYSYNGRQITHGEFVKK